MPCTNDYNLILSKFICSAESILGEPGLTEAKSDFDSIINSKRRSSSIRNFKELVDVLEKRGHVGEYSIEPLRRITQKFHDSDLDGLMDHYEECLHNYRRRFFNFYTLPDPAVTQVPINRPTSEFSDGSSLSYQSSVFSRGRNCETALPENVIELICDEIGKQWMELARKLTIREGEIDRVNDKYPSDLRAKAREVLKLFTSKTDPQKLQPKLLEGLIQARRRDLKESVEELLNRRQ